MLLPECLDNGGWAHEVFMVDPRWCDMTVAVESRGRAVRGVV